MRPNLPGATLTTRSLSLLVSFLAVAILAAPASASQFIERSAGKPRLAVNSKGMAMITYNKFGSVRHLLAWGAINARPPTRGVPQVKFRLDYSGGWGTYRRNVWKTFRDACRPYDGPPLPWLLAACKAPNGTYWALQGWQTAMPDLGFLPWLPQQKHWWVHLSHWSGPTAQLEVWPDWVYSGRFHHLFGRLTYTGKPVYGFGTTGYGNPTDKYGRLLYLDTFNSRYGRGWRRENSFVSHKPSGVFCYGFFPRNPRTGGYAYPPWYRGGVRPPGNGQRYRITVEGPGVTPDIKWEGPGLPNFNRNNPQQVAYEREMNERLDSVRGSDRLCRKH
jgi:hypothetical protein